MDQKKVVFVTLGFFEEESIKKSLENIDIELKDFAKVDYIEEYVEFVEKYNSDPEIAWILVGAIPNIYVDGSRGDCYEVDRNYRKKPSVTYWESHLKRGNAMVGLATDLGKNGIQVAKMAIRILDGETIENIQAESPKKVHIILNIERAKELGIEISAEILGSARRIYIDFDGNYVD